MKFFIFGISILLSTSVNAWWEAGHMIVSTIAYHHVNPYTKREIDRLASLMTVENTALNQYNCKVSHPVYCLMKVSLWADHLYQKPNLNFTQFPWHFIDTPIASDLSDKTDDQENHVVWAIENLSKALKQNHANAYLRARELAMLVHLVGDIHQPLHNASLFDPSFPKGDLGGNLYPIEYCEADGKCLNNLHKLWDSALDLYPRKGFSYQVNNPKAIVALAYRIEIDHPISNFKVYDLTSSAKTWHEQAYKLAADVVYKTPKNKIPSAEYINEGTAIVEKQIALAGYRLAYLLNELLSPDKRSAS